MVGAEGTHVQGMKQGSQFDMSVSIGVEQTHALYPSYKSFDELIDIERLRSLDSYLTQRIKRHILDNTDDYFVNQHVLDAAAPYRPGVREIWLKRTIKGTPYDYLDIDRTYL